jgi:hypothetical protein
VLSSPERGLAELEEEIRDVMRGGVPAAMVRDEVDKALSQIHEKMLEELRGYVRSAVIAGATTDQVAELADRLVTQGERIEPIELE